MRLVHKHQIVVREVVQERPWCTAGGALRQVPGIVLHARTEAGLLKHLQVVLGAALQTSGFQYLTGALQFYEAHNKFFTNSVDG